MNDQVPAPSSPRWGSTTKMVVGLSIIGITAALLVQFRTIIGPLLLAFILAYLIYPVSTAFSRVTRLTWRASVNIIFLILIVLYLGSITVTGLTVVQQLQSLINFVGLRITDLPQLAESLSTQAYQFGPFEFSLKQFDLQTISQQLLSVVQPLLGRMGALISTFATGAAATLGWSFFVILVTYFLLADAGRFPDELVHIEVPGYNQDISRLGQELRKIWNAYLRGQLFIILLVIVLYTVLMLILGVRFAVGIAILSGLARFVPYVGPITTTFVTFMVAIFQTGNYFGLDPLPYAILVVVAAFVLDQIFDNLVSPRLLGQTLGVHPAGVLIVAIIAANLIGIIGLVLAAPVLATVNLLGRYIGRKMFDMDPWPEPANTDTAQPFVMPLARWQRRIQALRRFLRPRL
jgi:predicted PurR-regulated permease PerM